jgi:hypothetical protein
MIERDRGANRAVVVAVVTDLRGCPQALVVLRHEGTPVPLVSAEPNSSEGEGIGYGSAP